MCKGLPKEFRDVFWPSTGILGIPDIYFRIQLIEMKRLFLVSAILCFSLITFGQRNGQYCAKMKDGILVMVSEQKEITQEIILANGTIIKPDGNIIRKDGTSIILEDEECVDSEGNKVKAKAKDKTEMEEEWRPPLYK